MCDYSNACLPQLMNSVNLCLFSLRKLAYHQKPYWKNDCFIPDTLLCPQLRIIVFPILGRIALSLVPRFCFAPGITYFLCFRPSCNINLENKGKNTPKARVVRSRAFAEACDLYESYFKKCWPTGKHSSCSIELTKRR